MANPAEQFEHDVFLSYNRRDGDVSSDFPHHLHLVLNQNGIRSYIYSEDLDEGEEIAPAVEEAIKNSRIAVVILSRHYASSASCLNELVKIMEKDDEWDQRVMPLFYRVDPSWVRRQGESYQEAMVGHERRYGSRSEKVRQWREALTQVGNLRGWCLARDRDEAEFIQEVAEDIKIVLRQFQQPPAPEPEAGPQYLERVNVIRIFTVGCLVALCTLSLALLTSGLR